MAAHASTGAVVSPGLNESKIVIVEVELTAALASGETCTVTLPEGVDDTLVPYAISAWSNADPRVNQVGIALTSHDKDTGVTIATGSGAGVADSSTVRIFYAPCKLGT